MSINRVLISGNLTRDPEMRATTSGTQIMSFGVAVNDRRYNQQTGQYEDYPNFVDCTMFGTRAGAVSRFLSKGSKVSIEGKLRYSSWEKDGQRRSKLEVIVDEIEFMSHQQQAAAPTAPRAPRQVSHQAQTNYPTYPAQTPQAPAQAPLPQAVPQAPVAQAVPQQAPQPTPMATAPQATQQVPSTAPAVPQQQVSQGAYDVYDEDIPF